MVLKIGTVTIGQSPRTDIVPEIKKLIPQNILTVEKGALDELDMEEVSKFKPQQDQETLVTRMRDGSEVIVARSFILPRMQGKITELNDKDVDLVTLLCSGTFPRFKSKVPLIQPDRLIKGTLASISIQGKLGFLVPTEKQVGKVSKELEDLNFQTVGVGASPYLGGEQDIQAASRKISKGNIDLILMNCFGYTMEMKRRVSKITGKPVILVRSLLARFISELLA